MPLFLRDLFLCVCSCDAYFILICRNIIEPKPLPILSSGILAVSCYASDCLKNGSDPASPPPPHKKAWGKPRGSLSAAKLRCTVLTI